MPLGHHHLVGHYALLEASNERTFVAGLEVGRRAVEIAADLNEEASAGENIASYQAVTVINYNYKSLEVLSTDRDHGKLVLDEERAQRSSGESILDIPYNDNGLFIQDSTSRRLLDRVIRVRLREADAFAYLSILIEAVVSRGGTSGIQDRFALSTRMIDTHIYQIIMLAEL